MGLHDVKISKPGSLKMADDIPPLGKPVATATLKEEPLPVGAIAEDLIKHFSMPPKVEPQPEPAKAQAKAKARPKIQHTVNVRPDADGEGPGYAPPTPEPIAKPSVLDEYKKRKMRVSFVMESGTFSMTVMDAKISAYSVAIITNADSENAGFIPAIGSNFKLEIPGLSLDCFYPGSCVSIPELALDIMFLGRQS
jgi:hypothetical protein